MGGRSVCFHKTHQRQPEEHCSSRFVPAGVDQTLKPKGVHPPSAIGNQVLPLEIHAQRRPRPLQQRPATYQGLISAHLALPEAATREFERMPVPTPRTSARAGSRALSRVGPRDGFVEKARSELGHGSREGRRHHRRSPEMLLVLPAIARHPGPG